MDDQDDEFLHKLDDALDPIMFQLEFKIYLDYIEFMEEFLNTEQTKEQLIINTYLKTWGQREDKFDGLERWGFPQEKLLSSPD